MKERTKQILRYVACGLGGLALGIGLLGGLSMCATSSNKTTESVNTILAKTPKGEQITTENGGYTGYKMSFTGGWGLSTPNNKTETHVYSINHYNWTPTEIALDGMVTLGDHPYWSDDGVYNWQTFVNVVNQRYNDAKSNTANEVRLMHTWGSVNWGNWGTNAYLEYWSFVAPAQGLRGFSFVYITPSWTTYEGLKLDSYETAFGTNQTQRVILTYAKTGYFLIDTSRTVIPGEVYFQDVESYYKELGYQDGYDNGHDTGFDDGYADGYDFGYSTGHTAGYSEGYDDAYAEKDSGIAFTSCGVYPNTHVTLQTDETIGNFKYMYLCHYITKPGYDEHTIYIMWTQNATTHQYLGEVIDRNDSDSYDPAVTLGSFTQEVTPSVTITATEDIEFGLWVGYITTFHNRGEITNSILWFQGGTSESDMQIYQNGYDEGYQNGNQQGQETGYEEGYDRGHEVGDAEGYSRGYTEGFNQTNTKNVFSLFTSAFDSVASFFDLKIFGFLPLYWFFLAPLFIALISLLMRMVKH